MAKSVMGKKAKQETETVVVQEPVLSEDSQRAIQAWKDRSSNQEQESKALVDANAAKKFNEENQVINEMLTRASQYGELLDSDPTYAEDAAEIVKAKEIDDTKVVTFLKHIDSVLDDEQRALLPWPGSVLATEEAKRPKGSNQPLLFDKPMAAGQQKTFYNQMISSTTLGKQAQEEIEQIQHEIDLAKVKTEGARLPENLESDMKKAKTKLNNLTVALRTAAQVYLMIQELKHKCPHIVFSWIRETINDEEKAKRDPKADMTRLRVVGAGDVVKAATCISMFTKPLNPDDYDALLSAVKKQKTYSVNSFKRFKIDRAVERAKAIGNTRVTLDDLNASAKKKPPEAGGNRGKTPTVDKSVRVVNSLTDMNNNAVEIERYLIEDTAKQTSRYQEFKGSVGVTDEMLSTWYRLYKLLRATFDGDPKLEEKAKTVIAAQDK